jgi:exodeoxyribonuclease-3
MGYTVAVSGQKAYNGVAIFSKPPLEAVSCGFSPIVGEAITGKFDEQKRVITAVVDGIRIVNVYIPNGSSVGSDKYEYKLGWLEILKQYLQQLLHSETKICLCGDFNVAPENRDIYDPKKGEGDHIMASVEERSAIALLQSLGFQDAFRKFTREGGHYSWWDYRTRAFSKDRGWRIDHHFLTEELYQQAQNCWIDRAPRQQEKPSDHAPVVLEV